ncbi:MAG: hypothetical protein LBO05_08115 [Deltaproteobacteria bacterium]|jgi:hypothetical protein|nr:hypothetical protein [Deltaproteobacteria bacterium]
MESYKPSGKYLPSAYYLIPLTYAVATSLLGVLYSLAIFFIPIVYFNILAIVLFTYGASIVGGMTVRRSRTRAPALAAGLACLGSAVGFYVSWCFWIYLVFKKFAGGANFLEILTSPDGMRQAVMGINEYGTWSLKKTVVKGIFLWLVWAGEAAAYFILTCVYAVKKATRPYSESVDRWIPAVFEDLKLNLPEGPGEPEATLAKLSQGDLSWLKTARQFQGDDKNARALEIDLYTDPVVSDAYLSARLKGKGKKNDKTDSHVLKLAKIPFLEAQELGRRLLEREVPDQPGPPETPGQPDNAGNQSA